MRHKLFVVAIASFFFGLSVSDLATLHGFPEKKVMLELRHDGTEFAAFQCNKIASVLGENFSDFDPKVGKQTNCRMAVTGHRDHLGVFHGRYGWNNWLGRLRGLSSSLDIPPDLVKSIENF